MGSHVTLTSFTFVTELTTFIRVNLNLNVIWNSKMSDCPKQILNFEYYIYLIVNFTKLIYLLLTLKWQTVNRSETPGTSAHSHKKSAISMRWWETSAPSQSFSVLLGRGCHGNSLASHRMFTASLNTFGFPAKLQTRLSSIDGVESFSTWNDIK